MRSVMSRGDGLVVIARRQRPVKGGREPLPACVIHSIRAWVEQQARRFNVSKSFVVATAMAQVAGITIDEHYYDR